MNEMTVPKNRITNMYTTRVHGPGPVAKDPDEHFVVVHAAYGMAPLVDYPTRTPDEAARQVHVTLTWTQAIPFEVVVVATDPATGRRTTRSMARALLEHGNLHTATLASAVLVSHLDRNVWIRVRAETPPAAFALDAEWLSHFLDATRSSVHPAHEWDEVPFPDDLHQARDNHE